MLSKQDSILFFFSVVAVVRSFQWGSERDCWILWGVDTSLEHGNGQNRGCWSDFETKFKAMF